MKELLLLLAGLALGYGIRFIMSKKELALSQRELEMTKKTQEDAQKQLSEHFKALASDTLKSNSEHFLMLAQEKFKTTQKEVVTNLGNQKDVIANLIKEIRTDIDKNAIDLKKNERDRVSSFSALKEELEQYRKITTDLKSSTEQLRRVLSNNQMRGLFGEQIAENLLKMAGFVIGQDYVYNKKQDQHASRPDFTIFLPDKTKINVDVKFPYASLIKFTETENAQEKETHLKRFEQDVKQKIKQVTSRDYIDPQENTVDFVILFIPNEMIFSFIYEKMNDIWEDAMRKKVILSGPFTFTAFLRMIKQAHDNFMYQKNLQHIIGHIQKFSQEYQKYNEAVDTLGKKIKSVDSQYQTIVTTRDRALTRIVDKIQNESNVTQLDAEPEITLLRE